MTLGVLQSYERNEGDAWNFTLDALAGYLERVLSEQDSVELKDIPAPAGPLVELIRQETPTLAADLIGSYLRSAELLGQRTGELHVALASAPEDPAFSPEPFTPFYQRALYQSMRGLTATVIPLLQKRLTTLPPDVRGDAREVVGLEERIIDCFRAVAGRRTQGMRIRCHGDYHLGQVLFTGNDFVIIDFEGEPARPLSERRLKRPPLRDVAGMLRSFHYAASAAVFKQMALGVVSPERFPVIERWASLWHSWVGAAFLRSYLQVAGQVPILPPAEDELKVLLNAFLLEKAVYEVGYELNNRPHWVGIPLRGILQLMECSA
jgi:maltose alpha-D-glucosyltransferase/alpha-amylase